MPESRLQRTRAAYREPTQNELDAQWAKALNAPPVLSRSRIYVDEHGRTHRVIDPNDFKARG